MTRTVRLWWIASGGMVILFAISCLLDYVRFYADQPVTGSSPYWVYLLVRAIEFLIPAVLFAGIALVLQWRHHRLVRNSRQNPSDPGSAAA